MNVQEFNTWLSDYRDRFPLTDEWLSKQANQERLLWFWQDSLKDVLLSDAMSVNARLMRGDLPPIENYDRDKIPGIVRSHANANKTTAARDQERYAPTRREAPEGSAREKCMRIEELLAQGQTLKQASAEVFPNPPDSTERYRCWPCRDTAWVDCWSNLAIKAAIQCKKIPVGAPARMSVRCTCSRAPTKLGDSERYTPEKYCAYEDGDEEKLRAWIAFRQAEELKRRRHSEFDAFNQRQPVS